MMPTVPLCLGDCQPQKSAHTLYSCGWALGVCPPLSLSEVVSSCGGRGETTISSGDRLEEHGARAVVRQPGPWALRVEQTTATCPLPPPKGQRACQVSGREGKSRERTLKEQGEVVPRMGTAGLKG